LCQFALKSVNSFSKYSVHKLVTDELTDELTDERTDGQVVNIMRPASLDWRIEKYSRGYVRSIAFACFYHAERVLFVKAKFLVHLLGEGEGRVKQEREEVGDESWERTGGYGGAGNGNARKNIPKT